METPYLQLELLNIILDLGQIWQDTILASQLK